MKFSHHNVKEAYETLKGQTQHLQDRLSICIETTKLVEAKYEGKQRVLNKYIDEVAELKRDSAEKEKKINKLQSYHASSYILERIFNIIPDDNGSEKNKKNWSRISSGTTTVGG
ncbi:hypothetical protein Hanom_Chr10g00919661 [Helianthus anomalus]